MQGTNPKIIQSVTNKTIDLIFLNCPSKCYKFKIDFYDNLSKLTENNNPNILNVFLTFYEIYIIYKIITKVYYAIENI